MFLQGLRNRLFASGVTVTTIKPGFGHADDPAGPALLVARLSPRPGASKAVLKGEDQAYVPRFWRPVMF